MNKTLTHWFWLGYFFSIGFKKSPFIYKTPLHFVWNVWMVYIVFLFELKVMNVKY